MRNAHYQLVNYINIAQQEDVYYFAAKTILEHLAEIPGYNIAEVAALCYVSPATISRLIRRLNYPSFNEFKKDVNHSLAELSSPHYPGEPVTDMAGHDGEELKAAFYQKIQENLAYTQEHLKMAVIDRVVSYMKEAEHIYFFGYSFAQMLTGQLQTTLAVDQKPVLASTNIKQQLELLRNAGPDDLLIVTTITGNYFRYNPDALRLFTHSRAHKVIITQNDSPASRVPADVFISVGAENESYIGKFSVMMVLETLEIFYQARGQD